MRISTLLLALAAGLVHTTATPASTLETPPSRTPEALSALLARYDAMAPGAARDQLALTVDAAAGQRYATVSRLFWYTDLDEAKRAAHATHRPILALRMLGRLDEELSCANSRLFRSILYANADVGKLLREQFVLYWSSERAVPRVTIDFGDGRKLERTTTGNSAHYVLDERGRVVDVLPGLYAPSVFRDELAKSARLAKQLGGLVEPTRSTVLVAHHAVAQRAEAAAFAKAAGTDFIRRRRLLAPGEVGASAVQRAQRSTMAKMAMEVVDLGKIGIDAGGVPADDVAAWAVVGQQAWGIQGDPAADSRRHAAAPAPAPRLFDRASLALIRRLHEAGPVPSEPAQTDAMIARLEQTVLADTALNQFRLRSQIRRELMQEPAQGFSQLNAWVYASVFHTPADDRWLGLLTRSDFTGLPGDGVVMR